MGTWAGDSETYVRKWVLAAQQWDECEINRIVDERIANPAASIPIDEVMRETLERGPRLRHLERAQQWDEEIFRRRRPQRNRHDESR